MASVQRQELKTARFEARITNEQKNLFLKAAALTGRSVTDFVIASAQETAARAVREHEVMKLTARDRKIFVSALLNPRAPASRLRKAARHHKRHSDAGDAG